VTEITPFTFPTTGQSVRTLLVDGEPWFIATDVAAVLGYRDAFNATRLLDDDGDEKGTHLVSTPSGDQMASIVSEPGLYYLIMRSNAIGAREFRRWVTHEVLPSIRKTGAYSAKQLSRKDLARMVIDAEEALELAETRAAAAEHQVLELAPAARMHDELMSAAGDYSVREAAQILGRDPQITTGQKRLFEYLREIGWLDRHNQPYQRHIAFDRLSVRARFYEHPNRDEQVATQQVRITTKGLGELHRLLGGGAQFQALMAEEVSA